MMMVLLVSSLSINFCVAQSSIFPPIWMKEGAYVEYTLAEGIMQLHNNTLFSFNDGKYTWKCIEVTGTLAKLKITLSVNKEESVTTLSTEVLVDSVNRSVYRLDGTRLGTTQLWLESNPTDGEEVVLWYSPPEKVVGKVKILNGYTQTPQGKQDSFKVTGNGTIGEDIEFFSTFHDTDTGILTFCTQWHDATINALNTSVFSTPEIYDTNIDLGPNEDPFNIIDYLPIILIGVAFTLVFIVVYRTRSKRFKPRTKA